MIIKFLQDTEVKGRLYLAGQSHEFEDETAAQLIDDGFAENDLAANETLDTTVKTKTVKTTRHKNVKGKE